MAKASTSKNPMRAKIDRQSKRPRASSQSSDDGSAHTEDGSGDDQSSRLAQLEAFGNAFLSSFGLDQPVGNGSSSSSAGANSLDKASAPYSTARGKGNRKERAKAHTSLLEQPAVKNDIDRMFEGSDPEEEAWTGFADSDADSSVGSIHGGEAGESDGFEGHSGVSDGEEEEYLAEDAAASRSLTRGQPATLAQNKGKGKSKSIAAPPPTKPRSRPVETVVFGGSASPAPSSADGANGKKGWKAFMSSKISKISEEAPDTSASGASGQRRSKDEQDEEKQLESNDRLLSHLLSTTLFAPGAEKEGKKRNLSSSDTLARIIELSASESQRKGAAVGRGWGETELQRRQLAKMPAKIRQDIRRSNADKRDKERDKAKELGTWHPSLKANYSNKATATEMGVKAEPKKRLRGIGAGIGKFKDGTLTLSKSDVRKINGPSSGGVADRKNKKRKK